MEINNRKRLSGTFSMLSVRYLEIQPSHAVADGFWGVLCKGSLLLWVLLLSWAAPQLDSHPAPSLQNQERNLASRATLITIATHHHCSQPTRFPSQSCELCKHPPPQHGAVGSGTRHPKAADAPASTCHPIPQNQDTAQQRVVGERRFFPSPSCCGDVSGLIPHH